MLPGTHLCAVGCLPSSRWPAQRSACSCGAVPARAHSEQAELPPTSNDQHLAGVSPFVTAWPAAAAATGRPYITRPAPCTSHATPRHAGSAHVNTVCDPLFNHILYMYTETGAPVLGRSSVLSFKVRPADTRGSRYSVQAPVATLSSLSTMIALYLRRRRQVKVASHDKHCKYHEQEQILYVSPCCARDCGTRISWGDSGFAADQGSFAFEHQ